MIKQNKKKLISAVFGIFMLALFSMKSHAYIMANYSDSAFQNSGNKGTEMELKVNVIEGAESFLKSYSGFLVLLSKIEISEINSLDYNELIHIIDSCILEMEHARDSYIDLFQKAKMIPYNKDIIKELRKFDYPGYQKEKSLNKVIFNEVRHYLSRGNIRGLYNQLLLNVENILIHLTGVKAEISEIRFSRLSSLWELNSIFSKSLIFGQYTAMIFGKIIMDR